MGKRNGMCSHQKSHGRIGRKGKAKRDELGVKYLV